MRLLKRIAFHEAGHCVAAAEFGIPVNYVTITDAMPHMHRDYYRAPGPRLGLKRIVRLCLAGPAAEVYFCGPVVGDGGGSGDYGDYRMAYQYLAKHAARIDASAAWIDAELIRHREAADRLVRRPWARRRIRRIAKALFEGCGTLSAAELDALI